MIQKIGLERKEKNKKKIEIKIKIRSITNKELKKQRYMIDYDKVAIDYIKEIEDNENYEFDIFDLDFMNEKQEKTKDDEDIDKYDRYLGMKKGLLKKIKINSNH